MWIKFPPGAESLSVEQQNFVSEYEVNVPDEKNGGTKHECWFRVPNHFVPTILGLNMGYSALQLGESPPGCHMNDLAASDPKRDDKIGSLAIQLDSQSKVNMELTRALERSEEQRKQAETECFILRNRLKDLEQEFEDLKAGKEKNSRTCDQSSKEIGLSLVSLANGDLTTLARAENWIPGTVPGSSTILQQLISALSSQIYGKLNRGRIYSRQVISTFDGTGNYQLVLPAYPVTSIIAVQMGAAIILASPLPNPTTGIPAGLNTGWGYRFVPWSGNLPGENAALEFQNGCWWPGVQNVKVTYQAGYLIAAEAQNVPSGGGPYTILVDQPQGVWSRDNGVVYASSGITLTAVTSSPTAGEYIPPPDTNPGLYTFSSFDSGAALSISYSFVPGDLEQACIQLVAESWKYRNNVGVESQMLGGQETVRFLRGGAGRYQMFPDLPPEVDALISPYVNVVPPALGAPV